MTTSDHIALVAVADAVRHRVGDASYRLWFEKHTTLTLTDDGLVVNVPNLFLQEWLHAKFADALRDALGLVFDRPMAVTFAIDPRLFQSARRAQEDARALPTGPAAVPRPPTADPDPAPAPESVADPGPEPAPTPEPAGISPRRARKWRRLGDFVVGACNRVAFASAQSVIEAPGQDVNPLVIHGPVGTGKTHLLEGVYTGIRARYPQWAVTFATAEEFTNRFVQSMRTGKLGGFRKQFRSADVLLLDDLHFLASKPATQEEFLHTFDTLHADGRQVVVTCDCHPRLADQLQPELIDRLVGGAVWGLTPPDADTRLAVLQAKTRSGGPRVPDPVVRFLAGRLHGNVRELEGAVNTLRHVSQVAGRAVDLAMTKDVLGDLLRHSVRVLRLQDVDRAVCETLKLSGGALQQKNRAWAVSHPRMLAMFLARKHTAGSYAEIGKYFGGRSHSTVVAAEKKARQWLANDDSVVFGERSCRVRDLIDLIERCLLR